MSSSSSSYSMHSPIVTTQLDYSGPLSNDIYAGSSSSNRPSIYANHMMASNSYGPTYPLPPPPLPSLPTSPSFRSDMNDGDPYSSSTTNIHYTTNGNDVPSSLHHYTDNPNLSSSSPSMAQQHHPHHNHVSMHHPHHQHYHQTYPHGPPLASLEHHPQHQSQSSSSQNIYPNPCIRNMQPYPLVSNNLTMMNNNRNHTIQTTSATTINTTTKQHHQTSSGIGYWPCDSQTLPPPSPLSSSSPHCYPANVNNNNNKTTTTNSNHWTRLSPSNNNTPSPIQPLQPPTLPPPPPPPSSSSSSSSSSSTPTSHPFHSSPHNHNVMPSSDSSSSSSSSNSGKQFTNHTMINSSGHHHHPQQQHQQQQGSMMMMNNNNSSGINPLQSLQKMVQIDPSISSPISSQPSNGSDHLRTTIHSHQQQQQYETAIVTMNDTQQQQMNVCGSGNGSHSSSSSSSLDGTIIDTNNTINNYPTYYNLDQNRLSATQLQHPQSSYGNINSNNPSISTSSMMVVPEFSPMAKNSLSPSSSASNSPPPPHTPTERSPIEVNNSKNSNDGNNSNRTNLIRFSNKNGNQIGRKNSKNFPLDSNPLDDCESPNRNQKLKNKTRTTTNITGLQTDQTHDHSNHSYRCGSIETSSSRDSIKSNDSATTTSDGQSSSVYGGMSSSQCSTPNNWKSNNNSNNQQQQSTQQQQIEFRNFSNSNSIQTPKSSWWSENQSSASSNRSFTPMIDSNQSSYNNNNNSSTMNNYPMTRSTSSSWSQQQQQQHPHHQQQQMLPFQMSGCTIPDGIIKKKRGRPFGSKNRRSLEHAVAATAASISTSNPRITTVATAVTTTTNASNNQLIDPNRMMKKRKSSMFIDIGINTNLSFDVHDNWNHHNNSNNNKDDQFEFESNVEHPLPLASKRKKIVGPVVRIDKSNDTKSANNSQQHDNCNARYSIVNNSHKSINNDSEQKSKRTSSSIWLSSLNRRKNNLQINQNNNNVQQKWYCILCQKPSNYKGLGELYGPYYIQSDHQRLQRLFSDLNDHTNMNDDDNNKTINHERRSLRKRTAEQQLVNNGDTTITTTMDNKNNKNGNMNETIEQSIQNHKTNNNDQPMEVWIHEDCIVWSTSVYVEGMKIRNLEPAIIESFDHICTKCKLPGATLGCIFKNCQMSPLHYLCAKEKDCDLDEEKFILSCSKHKKRRIIMTKDFEPFDNPQQQRSSTVINQAQEDNDNNNNNVDVDNGHHDE
ncbi:uncharacterized protein LOC124496772 isoform X1 [Dermatophagoides farinae]|uniref:uncharacterized protein LOC124496772 isoform X1 n=1 Tax=Dermatophagoides farinae TaxID=6954 RepID=UPI003F644730